MGYDFSSVRGEASHRLSPGWASIVLSALEGGGLLDVNTRPPEPPASLLDREANPEDLSDDDTWPFEAELSGEEIAYLAFRSPDPGRVPLAKLANNELWLISSNESTVLADGIDEILSGRRPRRVNDWVFEQLRSWGVAENEHGTAISSALAEFGQFCRQSADHGGFWAY